MRSVAWGVGAFALFAAVWTGGCASSEPVGPEEDEEVVPPRAGASKSSGADGADASTRPAFDASFDGQRDANVDPTPEVGDSCIDKNDPGGAENVAKALPATDDCDDSHKVVKGVINGPIDVDFYKFSGTDKAGCKVETDFGSPTAGLELCVYVRCKNETAGAVTGCTSGRLDTSGIGMKGCCAATPGSAIPQWDCKGITDNDSADFFVRVRQNGGNKACVPYSWHYRF